VITSNDLVGFLGLIIVGAVAGAVNSVAGGGTLVSFPVLVVLGQPEIISNVTSMGATGVGSLSSALGYRKDTPVQRALFVLLVIPSVIGSIVGAAILAVTPVEIFRRVVPFLVLFATLLLALRAVLTRRLSDSSSPERVTLIGRILGIFFQLLVATYGGYFSGGLGIMMLGSFSVMGLRNIHRMNALKTPLGAIINLVSFVFLMIKGFVIWPLVILMSAGVIVGGYVGARLAIRVNPRLTYALRCG